MGWRKCNYQPVKTADEFEEPDFLETEIWLLLTSF